MKEVHYWKFMLFFPESQPEPIIIGVTDQTPPENKDRLEWLIMCKRYCFEKLKENPYWQGLTWNDYTKALGVEFVDLFLFEATDFPESLKY